MAKFAYLKVGSLEDLEISIRDGGTYNSETKLGVFAQNGKPFPKVSWEYDQIKTNKQSGPDALPPKHIYALQETKLPVYGYIGIWYIGIQVYSV